MKKWADIKGSRPNTPEREAAYEEETVRVIAEWFAERWGYRTVPEACWNDVKELVERIKGTT